MKPLHTPYPLPSSSSRCRLPAPLSGEGDEGTSFVCKLENDVKGSSSIMIKAFKKSPRQMFLPLVSPVLREDVWSRGKVQRSHMYRGGAHKSQLLLIGSRDLIGPSWWHPGLLLPPLTCQGAQPLTAPSLSRAGIQGLAQPKGKMKM